MIVKIEKLSHDFKGISKINDKVVFTKRVLPDEVVNIKIIKEKENYDEGKIVNIITPSEERVVSICPYFDMCGGCSTGHINYNSLLKYKKEIVKDIIKKYANIMINPEIIFNKENFGYRNKISLRVYDGKLSLNEDSSNNLVNINKCLLVSNKINEIMNLLNGVNLNGINKVVIRGTEEIMVIIDGEYDIARIIELLKNKVSSIVFNGNVIYGKDYVIINVDKYKYAVYPDSFFQVNTGMINKLYDKVKEYASSGNSLLDLYCGAGTIGIYLADNFKQVRGIEVNKAAVMSANLNKKINSVNNIKFECKKTNHIDKITEDVVVVDPPRKGLDKTTIKLLLSSNAMRVVYVSCNPITLARDLNLLKEKYELLDITLFDMFPNTEHVECVCVLSRR